MDPSPGEADHSKDFQDRRTKYTLAPRYGYDFKAVTAKGLPRCQFIVAEKRYRRGTVVDPQHRCPFVAKKHGFCHHHIPEKMQKVKCARVERLAQRLGVAVEVQC